MERKLTLGTENLEIIVQGLGAASVVAYAIGHNGLGFDDAFTALKEFPKLKEKFDALPAALAELKDLDVFEAADLFAALVEQFKATLEQIQALQESYSD